MTRSASGAAARMAGTSMPPWPAGFCSLLSRVAGPSLTCRKRTRRPSRPSSATGSWPAAAAQEGSGAGPAGPCDGVPAGARRPVGVELEHDLGGEPGGEHLQGGGAVEVGELERVVV